MQEADPSNVRSYLLLCRQCWKIKGYAQKRKQEEDEELRKLETQMALSGDGSPGRVAVTGMLSPAGRNDIDSLLQQREMRINASIEQLTDALSKLKESQAATNDEILHRLRDLDKKL